MSAGPKRNNYGPVIFINSVSMSAPRVWAPKAIKMELLTGKLRQAMLPDRSGWWKAREPLVHGQDYSFLIDGHGPFPDPRSPWQPNGIHGPSRWLDHKRFEWNDQNWQPGPLSSSLIYELHVGTFTREGTFKAVTRRLDHLLDLGVTHIELMPVAEFSGKRGWGYDGVDLYAPHHVYGKPEELKELIDICHTRGIAVILDVVYNHLGPAGNYLSRFGPYFTDRYLTPWGEAINFDGPESDQVRRFFIDNALMWLRDYHFDGLRIDAVHAILDRSALHFLEQLADEVSQLEAQLGRHLMLVAESDLNDPRIVRPAQAGGFGLDAQWNEDFHHALHAALTKEKQGYYADFGDLASLAKTLEKGLAYDGCYSVYRRRLHGRRAVDLKGQQMIGCLQNHDQVGNRALGERSSQLLSREQLKIGAALVLTSPFVPMLFQGEEWGASTPFYYFTAHEDSELAESVRQGRRKEFAAFDWPLDDIPDPQAMETYDRSKLQWEEILQEPHSEILSWHKKLIRIRRNYPALTSGRMDLVKVSFDQEQQWLIIERGSVIIVCNLNSQSQMVKLSENIKAEKIVLASHQGLTFNQKTISMPAHSVAILD
jgi:maltooligosyltrehalose trehalohydrolase